MKIDPKNPPSGAKKLPDGSIFVDGKFYNGETGEEITGELPNIDPFNPFVPATNGQGYNPLALFGISSEDTTRILTRGGIILLGAALGIVGIAMVISGTKTAALVASAIPVAGKVL